MAGKQIYIAEYESPSFSFRAVGETREEAYRAMTNTLTAHGNGYDLMYGWWDDDEVKITAIRMGGGTRDGIAIRT